MAKKKNSKGLLAIMGLGGLGIWLATRSSSSNQASASISIKVHDMDGNEVHHNSPYAFNEGQSYTYTATVTNTSKRGGVAAPAAFTIHMMSAGGKKSYSPENVFNSVSFTAGATSAFTHAFTSSIGDAPDSGNLYVTVVPSGGSMAVASATEQFTLNVVATVYSATVVLS